MMQGKNHWVLFFCMLMLMVMPGCTRDALPQNPTAAFLDEAWVAYKGVFIKPEGYVWDQARREVTSEGQSYALLRAVWMEDRATFDLVFNWTEAHLARPDGLYSWQWTPDDGGRVIDANTATDADQDITFALILASRAFQEPAYLERARTLLTAIRLHTGIMLPAGWIPGAGNWAVAERIINFSYFTFYAYPAFASVDPNGEWLGVRERAYDLLSQFLSTPGVLLPADFAVIDEAGAFMPVAGKGKLSDSFSFDAMRIYWRVALDCLLNHHLRACSDPSRTRNIVDILARDGTIYSRYSVTSKKESNDTSVSFLGSLMPSLGLAYPQIAKALVDKELSPEKLRPIIRNPDRYYDNNWTWFGLAAWSGFITSKISAKSEP
ncbi:hypothetical protein GTA51_15770 [Desulfovibrio aerotolerans]|uniref:cellulase n=1 Tax=Solidesulfovibrio aerotolerans TaxID=295255 RepID=A0A7C9IPV1_9BACT|nr:glycosyl hydrolase family 8 [Solidesulfovibrio aerotolerans]MYL84579.1 hypothetical protein [Solidesulfovibrio aerotolerans]